MIVVVGLVLMVLAVLALGQWYPGSGAEQLDWKPTRSPQVEAQNEIDDVAQMLEVSKELVYTRLSRIRKRLFACVNRSMSRSPQ